MGLAKTLSGLQPSLRLSLSDPASSPRYLSQVLPSNKENTTHIHTVVLITVWNSDSRNCIAGLFNDAWCMNSWLLNCALRQRQHLHQPKTTGILKTTASTSLCCLLCNVIQCLPDSKHLFYTSSSAWMSFLCCSLNILNFLIYVFAGNEETEDQRRCQCVNVNHFNVTFRFCLKCQKCNVLSQTHFT